MGWRFVAEEFVLQLQDHEPKEWAAVDSTLACDATNVEIEAISREIVRTASMVTKGPQVQEEVVEEDITLKIEIEIVLMTEMTEGLTIVVTKKPI